MTLAACPCAALVPCRIHSFFLYRFKKGRRKKNLSSTVLQLLTAMVLACATHGFLTDGNRWYFFRMRRKASRHGGKDEPRYVVEVHVASYRDSPESESEAHRGANIPRKLLHLLDDAMEVRQTGVDWIKKLPLTSKAETGAGRGSRYDPL